MYLNNEDDFNFLVASMCINKKEDVELATIPAANLISESTKLTITLTTDTVNSALRKAFSYQTT